VDQFAGRHGSLDPVQKADEFLVAVARHALADQAAVEDVERREQDVDAPCLRVSSRKIGVMVPGCGKL
jgi:hypothetical protein